jgi:hypothetical protein
MQGTTRRVPQESVISDESTFSADTQYQSRSTSERGQRWMGCDGTNESYTGRTPCRRHTSTAEKRSLTPTLRNTR